jgi:hypothetical protein
MKERELKLAMICQVHKQQNQIQLWEAEEEGQALEAQIDKI